MSRLFSHSYALWALLASFILNVVSFDKFNDNILFGVTWAGPLSLREGQVTPDGKDYIRSHDSVLITTKNNEKYQCLLPSEQIRNKLYSGEYGHGASPEQLLAPLTDESRCSYRLEAYWTYELCHGRYVRQFHDERTQKGVKIQEFYLGKMYIPDKKSEKESGPKPIPEPPKKDEKYKPIKPPTRKLEGRDMPYFEVVMGNGTKCDLLSGKPRQIHVLYFCHPQGNNEVLSIKELSTCVYEMEVITPNLCSSEYYRFQEEPIHEISCHSLGGSADQPQSYTQFLEDQDLDRTGQRQTILFEQGKLEQEEPEPEPTEASTPVTVPVKPKAQVPQPDDQLTRDFLNGDYCLQGGTGWWKYELCYGKRVLQFHVDEEHGGRTDVLLGVWNKEEHIKWIRKKKAKPVGYAVHLYSGGDTCDLTGKPRQVHVRLRCKESTHLQEVSIYLMEPEVCQYILGVESPIICPLLERMDKDGLFH